MTVNTKVEASDPEPENRKATIDPHRCVIKLQDDASIHKILMSAQDLFDMIRNASSSQWLRLTIETYQYNGSAPPRPKKFWVRAGAIIAIEEAYVNFFGEVDRDMALAEASIINAEDPDGKIA